MFVGYQKALYPKGSEGIHVLKYSFNQMYTKLMTYSEFLSLVAKDPQNIALVELSQHWTPTLLQDI